MTHTPSFLECLVLLALVFALAAGGGRLLHLHRERDRLTRELAEEERYYKWLEAQLERRPVV